MHLHLLVDRIGSHLYLLATWTSLKFKFKNRNRSIVIGWVLFSWSRLHLYFCVDRISLKFKFKINTAPLLPRRTCFEYRSHDCDCLSIEIDHDWYLEYLNQMRRDAWLLILRSKYYFSSLSDVIWFHDDGSTSHLMLVVYNVVLLLTVEILGRTSMEISFCCLSALSNSTEISSGCFSASPHLYSRKFKRMALLLRLVRYDVAFLLTSVENFSCTSTENSSSTFSYFLHLCRQKFETMNRLLSRTIDRSKIAWVTLLFSYVVLLLTEEILGRTSMEISFCSLSARSHLCSKECIVT